MMDFNQAHQVKPQIVHDTIEGEVILLNLDTGTYYQLKSAAVPLWNERVNGYTLAELAANMSNEQEWGKHALLTMLQASLARRRALGRERTLLPPLHVKRNPQ
jgi:hypothetical protein